MRRILLAAGLLVVSAITESGCAWGYVTYFQPELKGAPPVVHADPYMRPPPPSGAELVKGSVSVDCTNIRKFVFLPFPWLRRGFRPAELQVELTFEGEPAQVQVDLGSVAASLNGVSSWPARIEYEGRRPAPRYVETVQLRNNGSPATLYAPTKLVFSFATEAGDADEFKMSIGALKIDGARVLVPPVAFSREGDFVSYHLPKKNKAPLKEDATDDF